MINEDPDAPPSKPGYKGKYSDESSGDEIEFSDNEIFDSKKSKFSRGELAEV